MFMWPTGDRELMIDLLEALTGARVTHAFNIPATSETTCQRVSRIDA